MSDRFSVQFDFLDQQLVDADGLPIGRVEDLELEFDRRDAPVVASVLTGAEALGQHLGGYVGRTVKRASARLRHPRSEPGPTRIEASLVAEAGTTVKLKARLDELPHVAPLERWLSRHVVGRIPGARG